MLFAAAGLYLKGFVGFDGVLIPTLALFSSFGPVSALAALGSTLQSTLAAGTVFWIYWMKALLSRKSVDRMR